MDNQTHSPLFGGSDDTGAIKGPACYHPVGPPLHIVKGPDFQGVLATLIRIPASLVVTAAAFREFMRKNRLYEVVEGVLAGVDVKSLEELQSPAAQIQEIIHSSRLPEQVGEHLLKGCREMGDGPTIVWPVTVPCELVHFSQEHQQFPYLEASGSLGIIQAIRTWWASLFEATAIFYRKLNGQSHRDAGITVAAQRMPALRFNGSL
jgi:phosphoenolpyruvate synthase/pyruvate phosphate dikinase